MNKLRRILALAGIILLLALYASTLVFALMKSPAAKSMLMAAVFCTVAIPVFLYGVLLVAKNRRPLENPFPDQAKQPEAPNAGSYGTDPEAADPEAAGPEAESDDADA